MRTHLFTRSICLVLLTCTALTGCFWRRPEPWSPTPVRVPPQAAGEFNVLWDNIDGNGFPSNPYWEAQTARYQTTLPPLSGSQYNACIERPYLKDPAEPGQEACTVQDTVVDTPDEFPNVLCFFYPGSTVHGHVDWMAASATGHLSWLNLADDWDYNFRLIPLKQATAPQQDRGLTTNNNRIGDSTSARYMELEFASSEVADQFRTAWWQGLANRVDPVNPSALNEYIHPPNPNEHPFAVAVGLFGLDCEHGCRSEFHPVYALAIQLDENPSKNTWAIFARNWGDEGFCSSLNHELNLVDQKMSLLLPWPGAKGLTAEVEQISPGTATPSIGLAQDENGKGEGALVTFSLQKPAERGLVEAILSFQWKGGAAISGGASVGPSLAGAAPHSPDEGEQDAEKLLGGLKTKAGVPARPVSTMAAPAEASAARQPVRLKVQLYRRQPKASTRARGLLGESVKVPVECGGRGSANPCPVDEAKRQREIALWRKICSGLKGNYPDERVAQNCAKIEALH